MSLNLTLHYRLTEIPPSEWNALVAPDNPFLEWEFLRALEKSHCVGQETSWQPRYMACRQDGVLVGAIPFYIRWDSYGEFIFDWQWAHAAESNGISYYPKGVVAAPFTPANGTRLLIHPEYSFEEVAGALIDFLVNYAHGEGLSSVHILFLTEKEAAFLETKDFKTRFTYQFHWKNRGYKVFDDFLADLHHKKRNQVLKERKQVAQSGLTIEVLEGEKITDEAMTAMEEFYLDTMSRKGSEAYLNPGFFKEVVKTFRHRTVMVMARDEEGYVAGSLNFIKGTSLFGRYWGARKHVPSLHFECCFYRLIDLAIERGLHLFEAGAQGEQKFLRGFGAVPTLSSHWIQAPLLKQGVDRYLRHEKTETMTLIERYNAISPLKYLRANQGE